MQNSVLEGACTLHLEVFTSLQWNYRQGKWCCAFVGQRPSFTAIHLSLHTYIYTYTHKTHPKNTNSNAVNSLWHFFFFWVMTLMSTYLPSLRAFLRELREGYGSARVLLLVLLAAGRHKVSIRGHLASWFFGVLSHGCDWSTNVPKKYNINTNICSTFSLAQH